MLQLREDLVKNLRVAKRILLTIRRGAVYGYALSGTLG
jgi:hypothetical protein